MVRVWKEVLCLGRQCDRFGRWFDITPRKVADARRNATRMLSRGVPLPAVWEHQDVEANQIPGEAAALAEWKRRYAKYTFGHIVDARINDRGNLDLLHEVPDARDAAQLLKTRFVSPKVYPSYSDSRGGAYRGTTIAHVAATPTPVQYWQRPFELSQGGALFLSYTPPEGPMADDNDTGDKGGADGDLKALVDALRGKGLTISPKVSSLRELIIAVESSGDADAGTDVDDDLDDDLGLDDPTAPAQTAPTMMSTTHADPGIKKRASAWAKDEKADAKSRINGLFKTGRIDRPTARQLLRQLAATEMSFTAEAVAVYPLANKLTEFEKRAADSAWKASALDLSATRPVGTPTQLLGDQAKSGVEEAAAEMEVATKRYTSGAPAATK